MVKGAQYINPFGLRMPEELRRRVEAAAAKSGRSLNAEVVYLMELGLRAETVTRSTVANLEAARARLAEVERALGLPGVLSEAARKGKKR